MPHAGGVTCPACGAEIQWRRAPVDYACSTCGSKLRLQGRHQRTTFWTIALLTPLAAYGLGLTRDDIWILEFVVLSAMHAWFAFVPLRLFPPVVEVIERHQAFPAPPLDMFPATRTEIAGASPPSGARQSRRMFQLTDPPISLEGIAIAAVGIALAVGQAVMHGESLISKVYPEFHATRTGPKGFPITVQIGAEALHVTNGSDRPWYCYIRLGRPTSERATMTSPVRVESRRSVDVAYSDFSSLDPRVDAAARRRLAREDMQAQCAEPSGLSHYGTLR